MIFIVASGNDGIDLSLRQKGKIYPAMINANHVITVGSISSTGERSTFSNYSEEYVDVFTEGEEIISTWPQSQTKSISGTSMASPKVAGEIAKLWSDNPNLDAKELVSIYLNQ
jgi:subtilisin family serine protease